MSGATTAALVGTMIATTAYQAYAGNKAGQDQRSAQRQSLRTAEDQANAAEQASNKANQKRPDVAGALSSALMSGKAGSYGTMLTGPGGIDPNALQLGKSTLLGG